jgi:hypothetical protein
VKDRHIDNIDLPANPTAVQSIFRAGSRNADILVLLLDNAESVRSLQPLQGTEVGRTIVKRNPNGEPHSGSPLVKRFIRMRRNCEKIAIPDKQPPNVLGINQNLLLYQLAHQTLKVRNGAARNTTIPC